MNFSSISSKSRLGRALRAPLQLIPPNSIFRILQGPLRGKKWVVGSSEHGCWLGSYESEKQHAFANCIHRGAVVWDVGAHVGFYSLLAAVRAGQTGKVVAFEPFPDNVRRLHEHLRINHITNVQVIEAAVADEEGLVSFQTGASATQGRIADDGELKVRTVQLDALVARGEIPVPQVIKMDVEGAEEQALRGALLTLQTHRPAIFLATHGDKVRTACSNLLESIGYRLESLTGSPIEDEDEFIGRCERRPFASARKLPS